MKGPQDLAISKRDDCMLLTPDFYRPVSILPVFPKVLAKLIYTDY